MSLLKKLGEFTLTLGLAAGVSAAYISNSNLQTYEADLNNNGIDDKFWIINGNLIVLELDGEPSKLGSDDFKYSNYPGLF